MIVTLIPNEQISASSEDWVPTAGGIVAALADDSDGTYVESVEENGLEFRVGFTTFALPARAQGRAMVLNVRANHQHPTQVGPFDKVILDMWWGPRGRFRDFRTEVWAPRSPANLIGNELNDANARSNSGRFWSQDEIDTVTVGYLVRDPALSAGFRVIKAFIELHVNEVPVVGSVGGVSDPETTSSRPTITWNYSDPENDAQESLRLRVFTQAQYSAGGFDPALSLSEWDSRYLKSGLHSIQIDKFLLNGTRYRAYPIVSDAGSFGRYSGYGPYVEWTQGIAEPAVPIVVSVSPEQVPSPRIRIKLAPGAGGAAATTSFLVERSDDGGTTYEQVLEIPADGSDGLDYTAPRDDTVYYRFRAQHYDGANRLSWSGYTAPSSLTLPYDGEVWLKSTTDPALNVSVCLSTTELQSDSLQAQSIQYAIGRRFPQIGLRTIFRETFDELPLAFLDDSSWEAFKVLRERQEILLLQTCYGDTMREQWFLRLGETQTTELVTMPTSPTQIRLVTFLAYEVDPPPQDNIADISIYADPGGYTFGYAGGY